MYKIRLTLFNFKALRFGSGIHVQLYFWHLPHPLYILRSVALDHLSFLQLTVNFYVSMILFIWGCSFYLLQFPLLKCQLLHERLPKSPSCLRSPTAFAASSQLLKEMFVCFQHPLWQRLLHLSLYLSSAFSLKIKFPVFSWVHTC